MSEYGEYQTASELDYREDEGSHVLLKLQIINIFPYLLYNVYDLIYIICIQVIINYDTCQW